jgi:hypothetical protein
MTNSRHDDTKSSTIAVSHKNPLAVLTEIKRAPHGPLPPPDGGKPAAASRARARASQVHKMEVNFHFKPERLRASIGRRLARRRRLGADAYSGCRGLTYVNCVSV